MEHKKRSFFERLTGSVMMSDDIEEVEKEFVPVAKTGKKAVNEWTPEPDDEAELSVDLYQTLREIVLQTMVAGVKPEDLELTISRDSVTIRGKREENRNIDEDNYFIKELYWGRFARTITLPSEIEPDEVEATERHGLLTIKLQKIDKDRKSSVKIRSI